MTSIDKIMASVAESQAAAVAMMSDPTRATHDKSCQSDDALRELIAATLEAARREGAEAIRAEYPGEAGEYLWRPHTDPGDAARLADHLMMYVDARGTAVQARVADGPWHRVERNESADAWCEAVTLCAAAVGERLQKGGA